MNLISKSITKAFQEIKRKMVKAPILWLPDFTEVFEVACNTSGISKGGVKSQEGHPVAYFIEKLNDAKLRYL